MQNIENIEFKKTRKEVLDFMDTFGNQFQILAFIVERMVSENPGDRGVISMNESIKVMKKSYLEFFRK